MTNGKTRFAFIDQYRGWAVLVMIETHVINAFLRADLWSTGWYRTIDFFNGLVAPSFLFLAGFAFAIVAVRKWDDFMKGNRVFWRQVWRYLFIWALGYFLHLPGYSLRLLLSKLKWRENHLFWGVDILHCIAASLLLMLFLAVLLRRRKLLFILLGVAGVAVALLTPFTHSHVVGSRIPAPFMGYLLRIRWSQFPLFPWMGYLFVGAFVSFFWQQAREKKKEQLFFGCCLTLSSLLVLTGVVFALRPLNLMTNANFSPAQPPFFFMKLGMVLMLLGLFWGLGRFGIERPLAVTRVGQESLLGYAFHIMVVYAPFMPGKVHALSNLIGRTRPPLQILLITLLLSGLTIAVCLAWHRLKEKKPLLSRRLFLGFWALVVLLVVIF